MSNRPQKSGIKPKILVIIGPTASGKSALAVKIGRKFNGGIISADSRQVYRGLNIGTGKITKNEMFGVPHYLLDIADPKHVFSASEFQNHAQKAIREILERKKLPIICGGTGFYVDATLGAVTLPPVPPNKALRLYLSKKSPLELYKILKNLDRRRAKSIDKHNKVRLIRAIEIAKTLGKVPKQNKGISPYDVLKIGLDLPNHELKNKIRSRLVTRLKQGMVLEAKKLHNRGLSFKRMNELGLEYRYLSLYLKGKLSKEEMLRELGQVIWQYAKRQRTWFRKDKTTKWFRPSQFKQIEKTVNVFLK